MCLRPICQRIHLPSVILVNLSNFAIHHKFGMIIVTLHSSTINHTKWNENIYKGARFRAFRLSPLCLSLQPLSLNLSAPLSFHSCPRHPLSPVSLSLCPLFLPPPYQPCPPASSAPQSSLLCPLGVPLSRSVGQTSCFTDSSFQLSRGSYYSYHNLYQ